MLLHVLQRPHWTGVTHELGELFILHKDRREARAVIMTNQLGWELRLLIGAQLEPVQTQVCRSHEGRFRVLQNEAVLDEADWSKGKKRDLVRFVAEKPR